MLDAEYSFMTGYPPAGSQQNGSYVPGSGGHALVTGTDPQITDPFRHIFTNEQNLAFGTPEVQAKVPAGTSVSTSPTPIQAPGTGGSTATPGTVPPPAASGPTDPSVLGFYSRDGEMGYPLTQEQYDAFRVSPIMGASAAEPIPNNTMMLVQPGGQVVGVPQSSWSKPPTPTRQQI
jgi:hypothetical protein